MNELKTILLVMIGVYFANVFHAVIFTLFKANQYEDTIAKKIAKEVKREILQQERQGFGNE